MSTSCPMLRFMHRGVVDAPGNEPVPFLRHTGCHCARLPFAAERGKQATAGTTHARCPVAGEPPECPIDLGIPLPDHGFAVIMTTARQKARYCHCGRISCQFPVCKNRGSIYRAPGSDHEVPALGQLDGLELLADALRPGAGAVHEHRHVRTELQAELREFGQCEAAAPESVQCQQRGAGVRAATSWAPMLA